MSVPATTKDMTPAERRAALVARMQEQKKSGEAPQRRRSGAFIAMNGNDGALTYGREDSPVDPEQKFVVIPDECTHGCLLWKGKKVEKRLLCKVTEGPAPQAPEGEPRVGDLAKPRERDGWSDTIGLTMVGVDGGDLDDIQCQFDAGNASKLGAASDLLAMIYDQADTPDGANGFIMPIITIESDSYENTTYSKTVFFPRFVVHEWTDGDTRIPAVSDAQIEASGVLD